LNASIEAARAGAHGAGFGVVADEICKLSVESMNVARKIEELLYQINEANRKTLECSDAACAATEEQAADVVRTKMKIAELKSISVQLEEIAKEL
jgi:methyl-accepting chemotaxis protein